MKKTRQTKRGFRRNCTGIVIGLFSGLLCCLLPVGSMLSYANEPEPFVVEYENLGTLIEQGNFSLAQTKQSQEDSLAPYEEALEILKSEKKDMKNLAEEYADAENAEMQAFYEAQEEQMKSAVSQMESTVNRMSSRSVKRMYEKQADALTNAAQTLMVTYHQLSATADMLAKQTEIEKLTYESTERKASVGLASEEEVAQAKLSYQTQQHNLENMNQQVARLRYNLLKMLGLEDQEQVIIGELPEPDPLWIEEIDLEHDIVRAIGYDSTYLNTSKSSAKGSYERELRAKRVEDAKASVKISMNASYQYLCQKQTEYQGAQSEYESACLDYAAMQRRYQSGLISYRDYLQGEVQYLMRKAEYESASSGYLQAYQAYQWEIVGIK